MALTSLTGINEGPKSLVLLRRGRKGWGQAIAATEKSSPRTPVWNSHFQLVTIVWFFSVRLEEPITNEAGSRRIGSTSQSERSPPHLWRCKPHYTASSTSKNSHLNCRDATLLRDSFQNPIHCKWRRCGGRVQSEDGLSSLAPHTCQMMCWNKMKLSDIPPL
jgi:hypothetical protein